jgi:hypothetical protein
MPNIRLLVSLVSLPAAFCGAAGRDARVTGPPRQFGTSVLWTDPAGLSGSPWPSFANPLPAQAGSSNVFPPAVPPAQQ